MLVRSSVPTPSWGELVPLDVLTESNPLARHYSAGSLPHPGLEVYGPSQSQRPTPSFPSSSGELGPGEYTFNESATRPTPVCRAWSRSERFTKLVKEPPLPEERPVSRERRPACQSMKPLRDPRTRLGRASSGSSLPSIRDAFKFTVDANVMVSGKAAKKQSRPEVLIHFGPRRQLTDNSRDDYKVPGKMGRSEGKLFLRSEFPRPNAGVSSITGIESPEQHLLFVGAGRCP
eukprot:CAMPEP_0169108170 /NCGR_PEP_ID=MMETSP1015-20121227/25278_1 /TAXON_ID=342587 /ORGANISM="Karlodinium micrum, Strain CCMP2283" /LENGTH=231 /DNA_ID=CAMNT_0009169761 /DNA_START=107 /DNA_END=799 /DNA_ORIENTATION=-